MAFRNVIYVLVLQLNLRRHQAHRLSFAHDVLAPFHVSSFSFHAWLEHYHGHGLNVCQVYLSSFITPSLCHDASDFPFPFVLLSSLNPLLHLHPHYDHVSYPYVFILSITSSIWSFNHLCFSHASSQHFIYFTSYVLFSMI